MTQFTTETAFNKAQARGHRTRKGHDLTGYYVDSTEFPGAQVLVRTCCKEG